MTRDEALGLVNKLSQLLKDNYVLSDIAAKLSDYLELNVASNSYDSIETSEMFAQRLTDDVLSICHDKHFKVILTETIIPPIERFRATNYGFERVAHYPNKVSYLKLSRFCDPGFAGDIAHETMGMVVDAEALIIDVRENGGGHPHMVQLLSSYFFDQEPVLLNKLSWRNTKRVDEFWTLPQVPRKRLPNIALYVLTSENTLSAAEEFCYNLKALNRATLIGTNTGGAAHPCNVYELNKELSVAIPTGKAINPLTKTNWERVGVSPDIHVAPDDALDTALSLISSKQ